MDKLRSVLQPHSSSNKEDPESTTSPSGPSGRVTGQGSHFAREEETTSSGYLPGTDAKQSAGTTSGENIGTAAIGETSTYSSHNLRRGDPIGNVADTSSNDPATYRMPEHTYGSSNTGVPAGAASTAASLAFNKDQDSSHIPGAFPDDDTSTSDSARGAASAAASGMTGTQSRREPSEMTGTQSEREPYGMTGTQSGREPYGSRGLEAATGGAAGIGGSSGLGQDLSSGRGNTLAGTAGEREPYSSRAPEGFEGMTGGAAGTEAERDPYGSGSSELESGTHGGASTIGSSGLGQGLSTGGDDTATETETHQHPFTSSGLGTAHDATTIAPSGQTPSAYPADRTGDYSYSTAEGSRAPYETGPSQSSTTNTSTATEEPKHSGTFGKILGGLGLGAAAGGATGAATRERESDKPGVVSEARDQPTTTTGLSSYNMPTRSEPTTRSEQSPSHHRRESIPTTAYPAGQQSPAPISSPVGGTTAAADEAERKDHTGRNVGMAGAGLGAGALGAHEYEKHRSQPGDTTKYSNAPFGQQTTSEAPYAPATSSTGTARDIDRKPVASTPYTDSAPEKESRGYGKTATAAGLGAGAAGAGAYAMENERNRPETGDLRADKPYSGSGTAAQHSTGATQMPFREKTTTSHTAGASAERARDTAPATQADDRHTGRDAALASAAGTGAGAYGAHEYEKNRAEQEPLTSRHEPVPSTKETRTTAPAATSEKTARTDSTAEREHDKSHTGRDAALVGAAGAGAGAYGMHEHNQHEAEEAEARRQKDLAEQEEARQRQYEKDQKAAEKLAHKEEKQHEKDIKKDHKLAAKEEKKHQKEIEKENKHHEKEVEKENKHHEKEVAAAETEHHKQLEKEEKARREAEEAERHRHEKEGVAAAAAGTGAAAYGVHEHDKNRDTQQLPSKHEQDSAGEGRPAVVSDETGHNVLHKDPPQEKKPGFFKRIFKRRKNKDTGLDEDYSTDEEDHTHHGRHAAEAGAVGAGAGAGVAGAEATHHGHHEPGTATSTTTSTDHHLSSYEEQTGGLQKPSYNPFSKRDHTGATPVTATHGADSNLGAGVGTHQYDGSYETRPVGASTGMRETGPAGAGTAGMHDTTTSAEAGTGTGTYATRPTETAAATSGAIDPENIGGIGGR
ncbi:hypothetical protein LTR93_004037 [Exophiala xenobiotica]|nr:hypothetical protein LTR93_004037 [Exophiala xenobiotica]